MKKLIFILLALCMIGGICYSQVPVKSKKTQKTEQPQSSESRRNQETQPKRKKQPNAKISEPDGYISDHGYVDLGLPSGLKWATCNVGASSPEDYGSYYAWGETTTKSSYMGDNSLTYGKSISELRSSGIIGESGALTMPHDAARANWGGSWRMPTKKELEELKYKCSWIWTSQGGHRGYKVTGPNGRSIFLPAVGWRDGTSLDGTGECGSYWSSTPDEGAPIAACNLDIDSTNKLVFWGIRSYGQTVRPVSE